MKKWWMSLGLTATILVAGCTNTDEEVKTKIDMTQDEEIAFMETYMEKVTPDTTVEPSELASDLNAHIAGLNEKNASDAIDAMIYVIYQQRERMDGVAKGLTPTLAIYEEKGLDLNDPSVIESIDDPMVKTFLEQMHERFLLLDKKEDQYTVSTNFEDILKKYGSFMADDLKAMVEFSKEERENHYLDEKSQTFNYALIAERIVLMEELGLKYPASYYASWFEQSKNFYSQLYFGMSGNDITNDDNTIKEDVLVAYQEALIAHKGTKFAEDLAEVLAKYKEEGNQLTDNLYVHLLEVTKLEHETVESEATGESEAGEKAKDTIKEAIKAKNDGKETSENKK